MLFILSTNINIKMGLNILNPSGNCTYYQVLS
jgi:hypothetical protein